MNQLKKHCMFLIPVLLFATLNQNSLAQSPEEFQKRRSMVLNSMAPNSIMVLHSENSQGATFAAPRFGGFFYYLSGINEANVYIVLLKGTAAFDLKEIIFLEPIDPAKANWDALGYGIEGAKNDLGFKDARSNKEFEKFFKKTLIEGKDVLYFNKTVSRPGGYLSYYDQLFSELREKGADFKIEMPTSILAPMIATKSEAEIEILRKAVNITAEAHKEAMKGLEPGLYEYQIQAIIRYIYKINGAHGIGFPSIVGSGINSVILHWMENSRKMEDGDIVVVDMGAEYEMYWADITRTYPVNGKYTERQKEVYNIVLKANEEAIKMIAPGVLFSEVSKKADEVLAEGMLRIGLIDKKSDFKKYYYHGLGHHIGLINARGSSMRVLKEGMVLTIEPGIYIREEKLGVRIEDDVLVTKTGYEVLSKAAPKKIEDIEKEMAKPGMDIRKNLVK